MFTKKHYEVIADTIRELEGDEKRNLIAHKLADMFRTDNPRFDTERFMTACRYGADAKVIK